MNMNEHDILLNMWFFLHVIHRGKQKHVPTTCCFLLRIFLQVFWKGSTVRPKGSKLPTLSHLPDDDIGKSRVDISLVLQMFWRLKRGVVTMTQTSTSNHDWNVG